MFGLGIVFGLLISLLWVIAYQVFLAGDGAHELARLLAILVTILSITLVGVLDDLLDLPRRVKVFLPLVAALPLMALQAGQTFLTIPFLGRVELGYGYTFFLVPLGVTGAANAVNMLAGFNGLEAGMGLVAMLSLAVIAAFLQSETALIVLLAGSGALVAALVYNWYPAKVLLGDVGTLTIGTILASVTIVGNFEAAGVIVLLPHMVDFMFKALHGFPSQGWEGALRDDGKLYCPNRHPVSLCQFIMKLTGAIHERSLVVVLLSLEALCGLLAIWIFTPL